jgi:glyoxylase I family protein
MEKVTGIGGLFFRAKDPATLGDWYQEHLGVTLTPTSYEKSGWGAGGRSDCVQSFS